MKLSADLLYQIVGLEVDPTRNTLRRARQEQVLRQKSLQVPPYLIRHRARGQ